MTGVDLPCGHRPLPQERFRVGVDHWCPRCQRWYGPDDEVTAAPAARSQPLAARQMVGIALLVAAGVLATSPWASGAGGPSWRRVGALGAVLGLALVGLALLARRRSPPQPKEHRP